jgi:hypothetical protein
MEQKWMLGMIKTYGNIEEVMWNRRNIHMAKEVEGGPSMRSCPY